MTACPKCSSERVVKNGRIHNGKQDHMANKTIGAEHVVGSLSYNPTKKVISGETKERIDRLLLEKLPLAGIARAMEVSESWLQGYVNETYERVEQRVKVEPKKGRLSLNAMKPGHTSVASRTRNGSG